MTSLLFLFFFVSANEGATLTQLQNDPFKAAVGEIAGKLPPGFNLAAADADGNGSVTWKELYDALTKFKIPNLDTGVVKGLVAKFHATGPKEGADAGLDKA